MGLMWYIVFVVNLAYFLKTTMKEITGASGSVGFQGVAVSVCRAADCVLRFACRWGLFTARMPTVNLDYTSLA